MKRPLFVFFVSIIILIIYSFFKENDLYYLDIGYKDNFYSKEIIEQLSIKKYNFIYQADDYRITDIINLIDNNYEIEGYKIQQELVKSDIITIDVGYNEYNYYNSVGNFESKIFELENDINNLFKKLRNITKEKILFIGLYNKNYCKEQNDSLNILNEYIKNKAKDYNIIYVDIYKDLRNNEYLKCDSQIPTIMGKKYISSKIIKNIK